MLLRSHPSFTHTFLAFPVFQASPLASCIFDTVYCSFIHLRDIIISNYVKIVRNLKLIFNIAPA